MKKHKIVALLTFLLIGCFAGGALATNASADVFEGIDIKDADPSTKWALEIDPSQAFNAEKLQRTVVVDGRERQDVIFVARSGDIYSVGSWAHGYEKFKINYESFEDFPDVRCRGIARNYGLSYPYYEILSINGVPWQQTEYAEKIKKYVAEYVRDNPGDRLGQNFYQWETAQNPKYNGFGKEIFVNGMSFAEAEKKSRELWGASSPAADKPEPIEIPVGENITLMMTLDNVSYTVETKTDTQTKTLDAAPFAKNGTTLIPVRGVLEAFGAEIEWLPETGQVKVVKDKDLIILTLGATKALVNGKEVALLEPAQTVNGRTLIPLRFISENLGYNVTWVSQTKQIVITG